MLLRVLMRVPLECAVCVVWGKPPRRIEELIEHAAQCSPSNGVRAHSYTLPNIQHKICYILYPNICITFCVCLYLSFFAFLANAVCRATRRCQVATPGGLGSRNLHVCIAIILQLFMQFICYIHYHAYFLLPLYTFSLSFFPFHALSLCSPAVVA